MGLVPRHCKGITGPPRIPTMADNPTLAVPIAKPEEIGLEPKRLQRAFDILAEWVKKDRIPAAGCCVGRKGRMVEPYLVGRQRPEQATLLRKDAQFLIASITKPITGATYTGGTV